MTLPKGIQQDGRGFRIFVRRNGKLHTQRLPAGSTLTELKLAREKLIGAILHDLKKPTDAPERTFTDDAAKYLTLITAMPIYQDRAYRIGRWVEVFGHRDRKTITAQDITTQLERWRKTGSKTGDSYSPATLNTFKTAIQHLYTKLDGKSVPNLVKDVETYDERYSKKIRAVPMIDCARIVRHLRVGSKQRAILHALMWTGWTNKFLMDLKPEHVDWKRGRVTLVAREKGKGMDEAVIRIMPEAVLALRHLARGNWLGQSFSGSSLWKAVNTAREKENRIRQARGEGPLPPMNPYVFRHSFGTWAAGKVKDDRVLKELLRTNSIQRYTQGTVPARIDASIDVLIAARHNPRPTMRLVKRG